MKTAIVTGVHPGHRARHCRHAGRPGLHRRILRHRRRRPRRPARRGLVPPGQHRGTAIPAGRWSRMCSAGTAGWTCWSTRRRGPAGTPGPAGHGGGELRPGHRHQPERHDVPLPAGRPGNAGRPGHPARLPPRIVNIGSLSAYAGSVNRGEYCISKAGVSMVTQLFAQRLAGEGIPVFEVRPGIIATDMTSVVHEKYQKMIDDGLLPVPRFGRPQDVADMVLACCSGLLGLLGRAGAQRRRRALR